ncbi:hypothetical protein [Aurantimonas sp. Leaf443]|uniref:hypothetical protein n=1 Tax=Aurantimonas sp. Leaf443 TaxID=1736378 RepID=UPI0006F5B019|nr:hypothetical protein [Aurantimonas sp. Leaf443]KQT84006.1 hypothetical protein ASG48_11540 [Aurantimonas sp. Leaf443]
MTELLEHAVKTARALSPERQDDLARIVLAYAGHAEPVIELSAEEEADLIEAQAEMERGEFASEEEVEAVLSRFRD